MVIRKMNSVFTRHGRVLFGIITLVIIISFLGLMTPGKFTSSNSGGAVVGSVFGKDVTVGNIQKQARYTAMVFCVQYGMQLSEQLIQTAQSRAYPDICQLAAAKERGIRVSDEEVANFIKKGIKFTDPKTKKFTISLYQAFVNDTLKKQDLGAADLDQAVRNQLIIEKLNRQIQNSVIVTDGELLEYFRMAAEKFDVMVARFNGIDLEKSIKIDDKKLKAYFEANKKIKNYMIAAKYQAVVIEFPFSEYLAKAAKSISKDDAVKYYNEHKSEFVDDKGKTLPLAKCAAKVNKQLIMKAASQMAVNASQKFANELYEKILDVDVSKKLETFKNAAAKSGLKLIPTGEFSLPVDKLAGRWDEPELAKQISLADKLTPVTYPVPGKNGAYIAYRTSRIAARPATFDEVKKQVEDDYRSEHAIRLAREKARALYAKLLKAKGTQRQALVKTAKSPAFKTLMPFSMQKPPMTSDGRMLLEVCGKLQVNGISAPQENVNGAVLVYMVKRTLPSDKEFEQFKPMVKNWYTQSKIRAAQYAFSAWVNTKCKQVTQD